MRDSLSATYKEAASHQETEECPIVLLTITHDQLPSPIRVCNNGEDIISNGETFLACPFDIELPDDAEGKVPGAKLSIANVDRQIVNALRTITTRAIVTLQVILASTPDVIEATYPELELIVADWNALTVSADLAWDALAGEPYPYLKMTPNTTAGVF